MPPLCDGESIGVVENAINSGETRIVRPSDRVGGGRTAVVTATAKCTTIDAELDRLAAALPSEHGPRETI